MFMGKNQGEVQQDRQTTGVRYRLPNQDEEADETFYKQLAEVSLSPALVLLGGCRRFLDCVEDNFLAQPGK